jgi:hypothetical protein
MHFWIVLVVIFPTTLISSYLELGCSRYCSYGSSSFAYFSPTRAKPSKTKKRGLENKLPYAEKNQYCVPFIFL